MQPSYYEFKPRYTIIADGLITNKLKDASLLYSRPLKQKNIIFTGKWVLFARTLHAVDNTNIEKEFNNNQDD